MKIKFYTLPILFAALVGLASCEKKQNAIPAPVATSAQKADAAALGIAYVEIDSLLNHYAYCKAKKSELETKSKQYEAQMASKMGQIEKAYSAFQQKAQKGGFASQAEAEGEQRKVQQLQQQAAKLEQELQKKMVDDQQAFNLALRDSVHAFLNDYNKSKKFQLILSKQGDNVLYANPGMDITQEVIDGLNKRYSKK